MVILENTKESLWTKDFTLLWLTNFLMAVGFYFLLPTMPAFAVDALGADKTQVGYIIGVYTLAALIIRPFAGYALDSFGRRNIYLLSLGAFTLLIGTYYFATSLILLLILRLIHGFSWGVTTTSGSTIVADILPPKRRGEGVGYFGLSMTMGMAIGPGIGLAIMGENNYGRLFLAAAIIAVLAFILSVMIKYPQVPLTKRSLSFSSVIEKRVLSLSLIMFINTLVYGGIVSFITLYSKEDLGLQNGGLFFLAYAIALSIIRPMSGKLVDNRGPALVVNVGLVASIIGLIALGLSTGLVTFLTAAVFIGIGNGMIWPTLQTMVINMVEPQRRGVANSTFFTALDLGIGGGSIVLGMLAEYTSYSTMYMVSGLLLVIPLLLFSTVTLKDYHKKLELLKASDGNQ